MASKLFGIQCKPMALNLFVPSAIFQNYFQMDHIAMVKPHKYH